MLAGGGGKAGGGEGKKGRGADALDRVQWRRAGQYTPDCHVLRLFQVRAYKHVFGHALPEEKSLNSPWTKVDIGSVVLAEVALTDSGDAPAREHTQKSR